MNKPVLVIMAAGMGSRYGGLKQIDPIGPNGQIILDYSVYDAHRAGFERVVFIIRPELHEAFEQAIGAKARRFMQVDYAYQTLDRLPEGLKAPEGREKPLGTAHAVWCAKELTEGCPIAVINADDFYGADAFRKMYDYLSQAEDDDRFRYCMVGYQVENTLTENGTVSRGVCTEDEHGLLKLAAADLFVQIVLNHGLVEVDGLLHHAHQGELPVKGNLTHLLEVCAVARNHGGHCGYDAGTVKAENADENAVHICFCHGESPHGAESESWPGIGVAPSKKRAPQGYVQLMQFN